MKPSWGDSTLLSGESDSTYKYNKGDAEANETNKKTQQENQNIYVISYRVAFWVCFVMINSIFLVQNRS